MRTARAWRQTCGALFAATTLLAACSGDSEGALSKQTITAARTVLLTKGTHGKLDGTITIGGRSAKISGEWTGSNIASDARMTVTGTIPYERAVPFDLRVSDGVLASQRTAAAVRHNLWPTTLISENPLQPIPALLKTTYFADAITPLFPPELLAKLEGVQPQATADAQANAGTSTYAYPGKAFVGATVTLVVGANNRLEHVTMTFGAGAEATTIDYAVALSTSDALTVEFPATTTTVSKAQVGPTGPFATVRSGVDPIITWSALRAPGPKGRECWKVATTPTITVQEPNFEQDTRCTALLSADDDPVDQAVFALSSNGAPGAAIMLVHVPDGTRDVAFGFLGGRTVPGSAEAGLIVWAGTHGEHPSYLELTLPTGERLACGLGAVATKGDLTDEQIANTSFKLPWTCDILTT